jgi:1-acyl-sn-glycerol-3-phosphate acyltransferase
MAQIFIPIFRTLWGIYALTAFLVLALAATALMVVTPGLERRRRIARRAARMIFRCWGVPLDIEGLDRLPARTCIVVANHASYLDGIVLTAALPARFAFVIKKEMRAVPFAGYLLHRIGSEFVERGNRHRAAMDARRMLRKAHDGDALAFFPEGTFTREPGLRPFRSGAFVAAARAGLPVVPIVIRGARDILPDRQWLPRPGRLEVQLTDPVGPHLARDNAAARALSNAARRRILANLGESDLAPDEARPAAAEEVSPEVATEAITG